MRADEKHAGLRGDVAVAIAALGIGELLELVTPKMIAQAAAVAAAILASPYAAAAVLSALGVI